MNERDQEAFAAWRPVACDLRPEFPLCLEDPGGLYPNILLCSCLALSETEGALLGTARFEPAHPLGIELLSSGRAGCGCVLDVLDDALDEEADPPLTPAPRIKSAVSIKRWAHSLNKLGSIIAKNLTTATDWGRLPAVLLPCCFFFSLSETIWRASKTMLCLCYLTPVSPTWGQCSLSH